MKGTLSPVIDDVVWLQYKQTHNLEIRNKILLSYLEIVKCNALKMSAVYKNRAELEDIVNQGIIVLMDCIEKFDPERGIKFDTFASIRVRGSIIDYIRNQDWVPRSLRKKAKDIENTYFELQNRLGREATDSEVARELNIDIHELNHVLSEANAFSVLSYEELLVENTQTFNENIAADTPEKKLQDSELKKVIALAIDELNQNEKTVISLYYYEELKLKEIAEVLDLTQSRVSQIHSKAIIKIKNKLKKYMDE
ncbi:MAG: hypothetical protein BGN88_08840 [Clostridiales bacterium 43-6]|nr:MAG: hypothetical protein BGN88_08840 [Clostridiales bacterium 43-6]